MGKHCGWRRYGVDLQFGDGPATFEAIAVLGGVSGVTLGGMVEAGQIDFTPA